MASGKSILAVIIAITVAAVLLGPFVTTVNDNTGTQSVNNETVTMSTSEYVDLDGYKLDSSTVVVYGYNETSGNYEQATEGDDYSINTEPGEIKANSSSTLIDDGEDAKVTYDYAATGSTTTLVAGFLSTLFATLLLAVMGNEITRRT